MFEKLLTYCTTDKIRHEITLTVKAHQLIDIKHEVP